MNVRSIAIIALFAAGALALTPIRIPTLYFPGLTYSFSAIPVVIAFLLFGLKIGILTGSLLVAGQLVVFPIGPPGFLVYPSGFVATLLMFAGMYLAALLISRKDLCGNPIKKGKQTVLLTALAIALRSGIMPFFYIVLANSVFPLFLPSTIPVSYFLVFALLYNVTSTLYQVPVACIVARKVSVPLGMEMYMFR